VEHNEYISIEEILGAVITEVGDEDDKLMLGRGYYISKIQEAIEFFALHTLYDTITKDFFDFDKAGNGVYSLPPNCFNIKEMYLFNNRAEGEDPDYAVVHWKRNLAYGASGRKTAQIGKNTHDPVLSPWWQTFGYKSSNGRNAIYANIIEGRIIFSDNAKGYKHLRLKYKGFGSPKGDIPCIPRMFREGIVTKTVMEVFKKLQVGNIQMRYNYQDAKQNFYGSGRDAGAFTRTKRLVVSMDSFKKESMKEYLSNPDWL
jgi:hypothetical protein